MNSIVKYQVQPGTVHFYPYIPIISLLKVCGVMTALTDTVVSALPFINQVNLESVAKGTDEYSDVLK